jgi:glutathione S-transferase
MLTLFQTEWCPDSRKVRERLTELGIDFLARQVEPEPENREALRRLAGTDEIPALVAPDGSIHIGEEAALAWLDARYPETVSTAGHRRKFREHEAA